MPRTLFQTASSIRLEGTRKKPSLPTDHPGPASQQLSERKPLPLWCRGIGYLRRHLPRQRFHTAWTQTDHWPPSGTRAPRSPTSPSNLPAGAALKLKAASASSRAARSRNLSKVPPSRRARQVCRAIDERMAGADLVGSRKRHCGRPIGPAAIGRALSARKLSSRRRP